MWKCLFCETENEDDQKVCRLCGNKQETAEQKAASVLTCESELKYAKEDLVKRGTDIPKRGMKVRESEKENYLLVIRAFMIIAGICSIFLFFFPGCNYRGIHISSVQLMLKESELTKFSFYGNELTVSGMTALAAVCCMTFAAAIVQGKVLVAVDGICLVLTILHSGLVMAALTSGDVNVGIFPGSFLIWGPVAALWNLIGGIIRCLKKDTAYRKKRSGILAGVGITAGIVIALYAGFCITGMLQQLNRSVFRAGLFLEVMCEKSDIYPFNLYFWEIEKADPVENGYDVTVLLKLSEEFVFSDTQDFADTLEVIMEIRGEKPYVANTEEIADSISG